MWSKSLINFHWFHFAIAKIFFENHGWTSKQETKGYKYSVEQYIHDVWINTEENEISVKAKCYRSQKKSKTPHKCCMIFAATGNSYVLTQCHCTCEAGLSQSCNHVVGLAYYLQHLVLLKEVHIPEDNSSTSKPMLWHQPRGKTIEPEKVLSTFFTKPTNINRRKAPVHSTFCDSRRDPSEVPPVNWFKKELSEVNVRIPFAYLLDENNIGTELCTLQLQSMNLKKSDKKNIEDLPISLPGYDSEITNILISEPPLNVSGINENFNFNDSSELENQTRGQARNTLWVDMRKKLFTASNFGDICKRRRWSVDYARVILQGKNIGHLVQIRHGVIHEEAAVCMYINKTSNIVYKCGLVVHPYARHLGASPDGVVYDKIHGYGLIEVKCPCGINFRTIENSFNNTNFYLTRTNGNISLKKQHKYYYQVQGQMLITGLKWCDFVVYYKFSNELIIIRIAFDSLFCQEMYSKLTKIYNDYVIDINT